MNYSALHDHLREFARDRLSDYVVVQLNESPPPVEPVVDDTDADYPARYIVCGLDGEDVAGMLTYGDDEFDGSVTFLLIVQVGAGEKKLMEMADDVKEQVADHLDVSGIQFFVPRLGDADLFEDSPFFFRPLVVPYKRIDER